MGELNRRRIRSLGAGESPPDSEPKRYVNGAGYVRLRWKLGTEYVETYERDESGALIRTVDPQRMPVDREHVRSLYRDGFTQPEIARRMGLNPASVSRILKKIGEPTRPPNSYRWSAPDPDEVVRLYVDERLGLRAVSRVTGASVKLVVRALQSRGIETRRPGTPGRGTLITYETEFERMRPLVRKRSGGLCEGRIKSVCRGKASHVHHRKIRSQQGDNSLENLLHLCMPCHTWVHQFPTVSYKLGMLVRSTGDPASIPVVQP